MKIANPYKRLFSLWGLIDGQHNKLIASKILGNKVLDVGCGYGSLVNFLLEKGFDARGIDCNEEDVNIAHKLFPRAKIDLGDVNHFSQYEDCSFDSIVLKDCFHHLVEDPGRVEDPCGTEDPCGVGEGGLPASFNTFRRILKRPGRIIILDPNPTIILRIARKLAFHNDPEATLDVALNTIIREGFCVNSVDFYETIGIPLSGGYVGLQLVPNIILTNKCVALCNDLLSRLINSIHMGRYLCWRYLISADISDGAS